jgi:hypothetical protein
MGAGMDVRLVLGSTRDNLQVVNEVVTIYLCPEGTGASRHVQQMLAE